MPLGARDSAVVGKRFTSVPVSAIVTVSVGCNVEKKGQDN